MKCPILTAVSERLTGTTTWPPLDCLQTECAWFSFDHERCALSVVAQEIYKLNKNAANVANLMPRGG